MFKLKKVKENVRVGNIKTAHGAIKTPVFLPDATRGYIKALSNTDLKTLKMGPMVVNSFHLYLQPGMKKIKKAGGIHKFMNWNGPLLSDSGGFQVFSLIHQNPAMGKITDDHVIFKSPIDGSMHILTPEKSIQIQFDLGVDMMVCFDDCPPNNAEKKVLEKAVERTIAWAKRCAREYDKQFDIRNSTLGNYRRPLIFAVIQGGADLELRKKCFVGLQAVAPKNGWDGFGFGARPVDADGNFLGEVLKFTADLIPKDKIRFALGIGTPEDIARCAAIGWDMFDCVIPTREGRHGRLFHLTPSSRGSDTPLPPHPNPLLEQERETERGDGGEVKNFYNAINILNAKFSIDFFPINKDSKIKELRENSKAYLHHLFKLKEPAGQRLASLNNLEFYLELMKELKKF
jgi:queuine tRNA-ribosyltransferase